LIADTTEERVDLGAGRRQVRLVVEYDGTGLGGWQRQDNAPTVQGHLEAALGRLLNAPTTVAGASRTDAGVHALGQVASFRTDRTTPLHGIRRGLNSLLPPGIAVVEAAEADDAFHPRFSATGKHYQYLLLTRPDRSPRWARVAWHRRAPLDLAAMTAAAAAFAGSATSRRSGPPGARRARRRGASMRSRCPGRAPSSSPSTSGATRFCATWCGSWSGPSSTSAKGACRRPDP
jgi:tRNA pseudouridine38-40 synthase